MEKLLQNVRLGARLLWRQPGFTAVAVVVLALGIGANSAMFSIVNTLLFRPLPFPDPAALAGVYSRSVARPDAYRAFSYGEFTELRQRGDVFTGVFAHNLGAVGLLEGETTRRVFFDEVSANYFDVMGVPPLRGRAFTAAEERPGAGIPVAIVSHAFWQKRGSDPRMVGQTLRINGTLFTVVGIAPRAFTGTTAMVSPELYLPLGVHELVMNDFDSARLPLADPRNHQLIVVGRLRPGLSPAQVDARLAATAAQMQQGIAADERQTFIARPLSRLSISTSPQNDDGLRVPALLLLFLAGVVLLIASLNVANMMLARGTARRREIAIRLALGAKRGSILAQLLIEGVMLAVLGGVAGLLGGAWSMRLLVRSLGALAPFDLVVSAAPDLRVLAATAAFCLLSTVFFALGPAWDVSRPGVAGDLKAGQQDAPSGRRGKLGGRFRRGVLARRNLPVLAQLALSLMLLSTAGLFVRSSLRAARLQPGFALDHGVVVEIDPGLAGYDEHEGRRLVRAVVERFRAQPGVESASVAATVPFGMISLGRRVEPVGRPAGGRGETAVPSSYNVVGEDYFATLGIPVLAGRPFTANEAGDARTTVAILDRLAAEKLWPGGGALGQTVKLVESGDNREGTIAQVVGIVDNVQESLLGEVLEPHVYVPFGPLYQSDMNVHVRLAGGRGASDGAAEARFVAAARGAVRGVDERLPVLNARTLRRHVEESFDTWVMRTAARLFTVFGVVAMLLAAVGLYGVRAFAVARRSREIGIRMAVGASAGDAVRLFLREGVRLTVVGGAVGLLLSLALGRLLAGMLYRVSGWDPLVLGASTALLAGAAMLACWVPARRAANVAPMTSLRNE
ncbi:MAG TPA: ABC transporter permease [Thermoanaerobaculia bacterium]|nr:ABC transporter permease [Thermoanaerobaculia bacterium]